MAECCLLLAALSRKCSLWFAADTVPGPLLGDYKLILTAVRWIMMGNIKLQGKVSRAVSIPFQVTAN